MVTFEKIEMGIGRFIDDEIVGRLPGGSWQKPVFSAVAIFAVKGYIGKIKDNGFLKGAGIVTDQGVNIEAFAEEFKKSIPISGIKVDIPMLGEATFVPADVDALVRKIRES